MNDKVKKIVSEKPKEYMQKVYDYMDKMGVEYIVDKNPTQEKIDKIKEQIKKNEEIRRIK